MTGAAAIDYSYARPAPAAIVAAGYVGVIRYLSNTPAKNLTTLEAAALHTAGLGIQIVWETTAGRATEGGSAGTTDSSLANAMADALGYPRTCPLFYAVDEDVPWSAVAPYFEGLRLWATRPVLPYGSVAIVDGYAALSPSARGWQTEAWSGGVVSPNAGLLQRTTPTLPPIPGGGYDEDAILAPQPWWLPEPIPVPSSEPPSLLLIGQR